MAHVRKRGAKWQAVVTLPGGRQITRTDALKGTVSAWAREQEADLRRGRWHDPRPGRASTLAGWREEWVPQRVVEPITQAKDDAHWRMRIAPAWGETPMGSISRAGVQRWVRAMMADGASAHTIHGTVGHLGAILAGAMGTDPPLVSVNPARGVELPKTPPGRVRWFTREEAAAIVGELEGQHALLVDLACHTGLRWGELAGLDARHVDAGRGEVHVRQVLTRSGLRAHAKSARSHRTVPVPGHLAGALAEAARGGGLVFTGASGAGPMVESNVRQRVWTPALLRAGVVYAPFHTTRHTAASWLVQAGVPLYQVQAFMGHENPQTTSKYSHLAEGKHNAITEVWSALQKAVVGTLPS